MGVDLDHILFMISWSSLSPQPKGHHYCFSHFCTDDRMVSLPTLYNGPPLPAS